MSNRLYFVPRSEFDRVRRLNTSEFERAALFADLCRLNTLSMIAYAGSGHIGSSFSSLDIVTWLFLHELRSGGAAPDLYFSSKGHDAPGLYAAMIACGQLPADNLRKLRRLDGLPGHPDVGTPHMIANTGSLGMGISKAKGMNFADRLLGRDRRIFVMTGDGELQEGQLWESLVSAANYGLDRITAIVDHNKLQSDVLVRNTSDLGDLEAKFKAFGWHVARCNGHDYPELAATLAAVDKVSGRPKVVIADTVKGRGVSFMESTAMEPQDGLYRYHSGAPSPDDYARAAQELTARANAALACVGAEPLALEADERPAAAVPAPAAQRLIPAYSKALIAAAERDSRIVALDGDLVLDTGLIPFREKFPERFLECGIAEQDMVSQAGGMALQGLLPVVHSFACFLAARPAEQIYNNASERTKVLYVGSLAGVLPGGPGHSHQQVNDIALLGTIPGLTLAEPCCAAEVAPLLHHFVGSEGSGYLRLVSIPVDIPYALPDGYRPSPGIGVALRDGKDGVIIGYGPVLLSQAFRAAEALSAGHGIELAVVNLPWLNRIDVAWLRRTVECRRAVFTLDNHLVEGGQGRMIAAAIAGLALDRPPHLCSFGLGDFPSCGQNDEVLRAHGLDAAGLTARMAELLVQRGR